MRTLKTTLHPSPQQQAKPSWYAIVDCNSFYCSCERLFEPSLCNQPVVVLSNNDGCIISRSDEAKQAGVAMGLPYFQARELIEKKGITVFSSNYNLYGDLSWRVMETLRSLFGKKKVEVYSVDEAFIALDSFKKEELDSVALSIKETVEQWTGIKVSVGIAATKVLSKIANRLAKKNKDATDCIMILSEKEITEEALFRTPVEDVWGVGRRYAMKLRDQWCIETALELSKVTEDFARKHLGGVTGVRLVRELKGLPSRPMEDERLKKKMIATTRMFGKAVTDLGSLREAIATYTSRAAEKLRRQYAAAHTIGVFVIPREEQQGSRFRHGPSLSKYITLDKATAATNELIKPALQMAEELFEEGRVYKKAGVILSELVPDVSVQGNLFIPEQKNNQRKLMEMIDNINFSQRNDVLKFAATGTTRNWKMRQELRSPRYTTRWEELRLVS